MTIVWYNFDDNIKQIQLEISGRSSVTTTSSVMFPIPLIYASYHSYYEYILYRGPEISPKIYSICLHFIWTMCNLKKCQLQNSATSKIPNALLYR